MFKIRLQLNEGIKLGASEAAGILMLRVLHIHSMSIWSQRERCHDPWHAGTSNQPISWQLPAWCCWSKRIMSYQFPQNSTIGCGKWWRGNSTDTPQGTLGNLPPMMETCDKVDRTWWTGLPIACGFGETNSCGMHACIHACTCSGNPACESLRGFRPHRIWWIWWHARGLSPDFVKPKTAPGNWQMSTRSRKTTRIPLNSKESPWSASGPAHKGPKFFIILVPVSRTRVHATAAESGTSTNILDILDIGINANDEAFVGPCGSTNSFNLVQTWNKRLISSMLMMLLQHA